MAACEATARIRRSIGLHRSGIGTVVERTSRYTLLVHLPRLKGYGIEPPVKNGPALGGYGAIAMKDALQATLGSLPEGLVRSLTWDRGKELLAHAQFTIDTGISVFFADPHSPWQRATNENTNGLLRQYFPKGTDLSRWSLDDILAVQDAINSRPRKVLSRGDCFDCEDPRAGSGSDLGGFRSSLSRVA